MLSLHFGVMQTSSAWNGYIDILMKNSLALILVEAMAWSIERVWAVQATMMLSTLWWVKAGLRLSASGATYSGDRIMGAAVGMVENPNGFAYMMCLFLPLYLYFYQQVRGRFWKLFFLLIALASVYIIFQTGSRTGLVVLIVLTFFLFPKYGGHHKIALVVSTIAVVFLFSLVDEGNIRRFKSIPDSVLSFLRGEEAKPIAQLTQDEQSSQERRLKNRDTWALIKEYPLFGVGIDPNQALFAEKYPYATGQVHNELLMAGRQMGFIGMGLYLTLLFTLFWNGRRCELQLQRYWPAAADLGWTFKLQAVVILVGGSFSPLPWHPVMMILVGSASVLNKHIEDTLNSNSFPT
jgi:O-antigen ligase